MPGFIDGSWFFGITGAVIAFAATRSRGGIRFWQLVLVGLASAYVLPHVFAWIQPRWRAVPWLPDITGGMVFIGGWFALFALTMFEQKGQPRRVPIWAGLLFATCMAFIVPAVVNQLTGAYQRASLRDDVNACVRYAPGEDGVLEATNLCDQEIVVGLCLPNEHNPEPCAQSVALAPDETTLLDPAGTGLSSVPGNPNGYTLVACRQPNRPSRMTRVTGRGFEGVCLPGR
ncbi:hypothetical protein [Nioella aestuarii]|uniref:hypothetical protein n=1 Tax=Nioella aestuarii TaxID=1662864 RepID=UPI003D7F65D9